VNNPEIVDLSIIPDCSQATNDVTTIREIKKFVKIREIRGKIMAKFVEEKSPHFGK
jgi:hypothetical protein